MGRRKNAPFPVNSNYRATVPALAEILDILEAPRNEEPGYGTATDSPPLRTSFQRGNVRSWALYSPREGPRSEKLSADGPDRV